MSRHLLAGLQVETHDGRRGELKIRRAGPQNVELFIGQEADRCGDSSIGRNKGRGLAVAGMLLDDLAAGEAADIDRPVASHGDALGKEVGTGQLNLAAQALDDARQVLVVALDIVGIGAGGEGDTGAQKDGEANSCCGFGFHGFLSLVFG